MSKKRQIRIAQIILNETLYKVEDVITERSPFTVTLKFSGNKKLTLTGKLAADIIKAGRD